MKKSVATKYAKQAKFNAEQGSLIFDEARHAIFIGRGKAFRSVRAGKLTQKSIQKAETLKKGMITYASRYGTPEQAEFFRRASPYKLRWMYNEGILDPEMYFEYEIGTVDAIGGRLEGMGIAESKIQGMIDAYNYLSREGR